MDVNEILDVLGNESRRRILSLLSRRPCYVSEIAYCLRMAPKVVLDHLERLERAGIVNSFEDGKRRYYYIDRSLRIEITLTPHRFSAKVVEDGELEMDVFDVLREIMNLKYDSEPTSIIETISKIERAQEIFSRIQCYINSKINSMLDELISAIERFTSDDVERFVLYGLAKGLKDYEIAESFGLMYSDVESALKRLERRGLIRKVVDGSRIVWKFG
ncbi:MAG: ArsR family transcriptional regulator [Archaeoglobales archaeon]|nr:MAG: ArsR family transcriptional regulator [Archaeoglobales archaeon]